MAYRPAKNTVILIVINNITPKEVLRGFPQNVNKGAKDYISNYYGPSNKRHQISFFVNDTCSDYQWHFVAYCVV